MADNREVMLAQIAEDNTAVLGLYDSLDPQRVIYGESGWTVKDILRHVADWDAQVVTALQAWVHGEVYRNTDLDDFDAINGVWRAAHKDDSAAEVRAFFLETRQQMAAALRTLPTARASTEFAAPWMQKKPTTALLLVQDMLEHGQEHMQDIRAAL